MPPSEIIRTDDNSQYYALLSAAVEHWSHPSLFSDEQVHEVKAIFKEVFAQDKPLSGRTISDAILLSTEDQPTLFYVAHLPEDHVGRVTWLKVAVCNLNFGVSKQATLQEFFMVLGTSRPRSPSPEEPMKRHYSPEHFSRVTGREPNDPSPLLQTNATLAKMFRETELLGFEVCIQVMRDDNGALTRGLHLDWEDLDKLKRGYAPQGFTVSFKATDVFFNTDCFDDEAWATDLFNGTDYFDNEAWATAWFTEVLTPKSGMVVDETYGPYPIDLYTWGDWDEYIESVMRD